MKNLATHWELEREAYFLRDAAILSANPVTKRHAAELLVRLQAYLARLKMEPEQCH